MNVQHRLPSTFHRVIAALGVALVLLLNVLAFSPELHAWVHGHETLSGQTPSNQTPKGDVDHACAVTLFAQGVTVAVGILLLLLARLLARGITLKPVDWPLVARPHYWLVPSHAPPLN